ncbi:hypothetical protein F5Y19DRAFT_476645 [Xylariaceae sp. FL1651]|nr:hypothetical protein F5Y19DRAFT_476645 [Xylariaceae sp. FL1651]
MSKKIQDRKARVIKATRSKKWVPSSSVSEALSMQLGLSMWLSDMATANENPSGRKRKHEGYEDDNKGDRTKDAPKRITQGVAKRMQLPSDKGQAQNSILSPFRENHHGPFKPLHLGQGRREGESTSILMAANNAYCSGPQPRVDFQENHIAGPTGNYVSQPTPDDLTLDADMNDQLGRASTAPSGNQRNPSWSTGLSMYGTVSSLPSGFPPQVLPDTTPDYISPIPPVLFSPRPPPHLPAWVLNARFGDLLRHSYGLTLMVHNYQCWHGREVFAFWTPEEIALARSRQAPDLASAYYEAQPSLPPHILNTRFQVLLLAAPLLSNLIQRYHTDVGVEYFGFFGRDRRDDTAVTGSICEYRFTESSSDTESEWPLDLSPIPSDVSSELLTHTQWLGPAQLELLQAQLQAQAEAQWQAVCERRRGQQQLTPCAAPPTGLFRPVNWNQERTRPPFAGPCVSSVAWDISMIRY